MPKFIVVNTKMAALARCATAIATVAVCLFVAQPVFPSRQDTLDFWQHTLDLLEAFPPGLVRLLDGTYMWETGYCNKIMFIRCWPARTSSRVVLAAGFPANIAPPDDGMTWLVLPQLRWTVAGLPDRDAYCLRARALWIAQTLRAAEWDRRQSVRTVLLAEGLDAPAALAVAAIYEQRVAGVVLVNPRPWRHFSNGRIALEGIEGKLLSAFLAKHPRWRRYLAEGLQVYDIEQLIQCVQCPVVVLTSLRRPPRWLWIAAREYGWMLEHSDRRSPPLSELARSPVFGALWARALDDIDFARRRGLLARAGP